MQLFSPANDIKLIYMFRRNVFLNAKALSEILRKFRVAGAHPDVIYSIDPIKAKNNGDELIRLEDILSIRELGKQSPQYSQLEKPHSFVFWIQTDEWIRWKESNRVKPQPITPLTPITCTLTPMASDATVKQQLKDLFKQAKITDDFDLRKTKLDEEFASMQSAFTMAGERTRAFATSAKGLLQKADLIIDNLRSFGTFVVINVNKSSLLVTLPVVDSIPSEYKRARTGFSDSILIDPSQLSNATMKYMEERSLKPFDLQAAGSESAVQQLVFAFDKIYSAMALHRGKALRPTVTIVVDVFGEENFISSDNCIVLSLKRIGSWEEFLLSIEQPTWLKLVERHQKWMVVNSPDVEARKRHLLRIADAFGVFGAALDNVYGSDDILWQQELLHRLHKDEGLIRKTIEKYSIKDSNAKKRVMLNFSNRLTSINGEPIDYRLGASGHIYFHTRATTPQILKVLKDNLTFAATKSLAYDKMLSRLTRAAAAVKVNISIDESFKRNRDASLIEDLTTFVNMIEKHINELSLFTKKVSTGMNWVISERFDVSQSGVIYMPFDIDFATLKQHLLS